MFAGRQACRAGRTACVVSSRSGRGAGGAAATGSAAPRCLSTRSAGGVLLDTFPGLPPNNFVDCTSVAATEITKLSNGVTVASEDIAGPWCAVSGEPSSLFRGGDSIELASLLPANAPAPRDRTRCCSSLRLSPPYLPPARLDRQLHPQPQWPRTCPALQLSCTVLTAPSLSTPRPAELAALLHLLSR